MKKLPELLAPAGSLECLKAAVCGGADAVYFGVPQFNARMKAKNFTPDELEQAFELCALYGVKTNVTLNTLLYGREFAPALDVVAGLEEKYRPDAYIVQDLGLARELKKRFPDIVLHASTQAEVHNAFGLEPFVRLGFSRVVVAREAALDEIFAFSDCGIETEIFIHGAMCVCQSGGCLMSSLIGGRSGNRGECAYPCRLPYKGKNNYPLSLKDMCLAQHITEILSLGVNALKIEGRMKPPSYVYEVTSLYRRLLDERRNATAGEMSRLQAVFSRSGFTDGYFTGRRTPSMFGIRSDADKEQSRAVVTEIEQRKIPCDIKAELHVDSAARITLTCRGVTAFSEGDSVTKAQNRPLSENEIVSRLSKLGNTPFEAQSVAVLADSGAYMPVSSLNALRRNGCAELERQLLSARRREAAPPLTLAAAEADGTALPGLVIRMGQKPNEDCIAAAVRYEMPLERPSLWKPLAGKYGDRLCLVLPRTVYDGDAKEIIKLISEAKETGVSMVCVENPEHISLCGGFDVYGGMCLNVTNSFTADTLCLLGCKQITVSPEANMALARETESAYIVYGKLPLMHTRTCIITNVCGCIGRKDPHDCRALLTDRTGAGFEILGGYRHTNTIYNSVPLWLLDKPVTTPNPVLYFSTETPDEEREILSAYRKKKKPEIPVTRGKNN